MSSLQYFRYTAYALIAIGLINLTYQNSKDDLAATTLLIVGTGAVIFALTFFGFGKKFLSSIAGKVLTSLAAIIAAVIAILN